MKKLTNADLEYINILRKSIVEIYREKCIRCRKPTRIIHEIEPRSLRPKDWWEEDNMVLLCMTCHEWAHSMGTNNSAEELKKLRDQRLREYAN